MARGGGGGCCPPMDLMRSEAMQLVQVIIPAESAHLTVSYLGDLGLLQFKDVWLLAPARPFDYGGGAIQLAPELNPFRSKIVVW
uniref:Uncharacterized protein n=1 Tax=Zea mays TaxID=4577 RepID=B6UHL7_MAIZE|nr:hypothetical protein [Zea mays]